MKKKKPFFYKKEIISGSYQIDCIVLIFAAFVIIFSLTGISVCIQYESYAQYNWAPILLIILSFILMIPSTFRILKRIKNETNDN
ncbi:MAG: hypothetical protein JRJ49_10030 [Deltaproteobacteria bacterium]|nr:hypothetical protein [Deltaproteobacteria bacterium]